MLQSAPAVRQKTWLEAALKSEFRSSWVHGFSLCTGCLLQGQAEFMNASYLPKQSFRWDRMKQNRSAHLTCSAPSFQVDRAKPRHELWQSKAPDSPFLPVERRVPLQTFFPFFFPPKSLKMRNLLADFGVPHSATFWPWDAACSGGERT